MEISKSQVLSKVANLMCVDQPDNKLAIILPGEDRHFFVVDGIAADCFRLINGKNTVGEICKAISEQYQFSEARIFSDFVEFVSSLNELSLIQEKA